MTTLTEVVRHPVDSKRSTALLAQAAELVASPQIRNQGTIGGNVSQDARCWYYRGGWPCYRAGGKSAMPIRRWAAIASTRFCDADRCVAVNPSDTAPALIALDAKFVMQTPKGEQVVDAEDYFIGPDIDITRMNILQPGDLLTAIRIPATWAGAQFYFEKVRDRNVWDFPLMNVASAMKLSGGTIEHIRIAVNGVRRASAAVEGRGRRRARQAAQCRNRRDGGQAGRPGRGSAAVQRLQDPADAKPGEARHQRSAGGDMGIVEWATSPWGQNGSDPHRLVPDLGCADRGTVFLIVHAIYVRYFAKDKGVRRRRFARGVRRDSRARSRGTRWPRGCSLDHGGGHVHAAVHRVPAQGRRPVSLGDLSLDRRHWC